MVHLACLFQFWCPWRYHFCRSLNCYLNLNEGLGLRLKSLVPWVIKIGKLWMEQCWCSNELSLTRLFQPWSVELVGTVVPWIRIQALMAAFYWGWGPCTMDGPDKKHVERSKLVQCCALLGVRFPSASQWPPPLLNNMQQHFLQLNEEEPEVLRWWSTEKHGFSSSDSLAKHMGKYGHGWAWTQQDQSASEVY